jgi:uncharacterized protein
MSDSENLIQLKSVDSHCTQMLRRDALRALAALSFVCVSASALGRSLKAPSQTSIGTFLGGGRFQESVTGPAKFVLCKVSLNSSGALYSQNISAQFFPHGFAVDPTRKSRVLAFEKIGPGAAEFDLNTGQFVRAISGANGRLFYGHGVFSGDGGKLYSSETTMDSGAGVIGLRDGKTLAYLGEFPSHGAHPHDCVLVDGGKTLAVTNGGDELNGARKPNLSLIDVRTGKLLEQLAISDEAFNAGHVIVDKSGKTLVLSAPRRGFTIEQLGAIHLREKNGPLKRVGANLAIAGQIYGEALSGVIIPEHDLFVVTHPTPGLLTCWVLSSMQLRKVITLERARGVALSLDRKEFVVSNGSNAVLTRFDAKTLISLTAQVTRQTLITGSHLLNWAAI